MKRKVAWLVALGIACLQGGAAQSASPIPVVDTPAALTSPNVHMLQTVPTGTGVGGKFFGKYFFETTARPGAFLPGGAGAGGLHVFDISDPELPTLAAYLPLPHWENEHLDISPDGKIALITAERVRQSSCEGNASVSKSCPVVPPTLFLIDISNPTRPLLRSSLTMPTFIGTNPDGKPLRGPGHIVQCVLGCKFAYVTAARNGGLYVADLRDRDEPKFYGYAARNSSAGRANSFYPVHGSIHDVKVDRFGYVITTGSGGTDVFAPPTDPRRLKLVSSVRAVDNKYNALIHHSAERFEKGIVMVNEESYSGQCGSNRNAADEVLRDDSQQGSFQTWRMVGSQLKPVGLFKTEAAGYTEGGGVVISCSSHWFSMNSNKIVAIGWYDQGVRFLDVSNPARIRQVGYWVGPNASSSSAAYFVPGRSDLVYVADYNMGFVALKLDRGGKAAKTVVAPIRAEWLNDYKGIRFAMQLDPDPDWGFACLRPRFVK